MGRLDRRATVRATLVTVLVVAGLVVAQQGVIAAVTSGEQPMRTVDRVPNAPDAPAWSDAPSRTVPLSKQQMALPFGGGSVDELQVQSLTNETHVAFRLSWADPTNDTSLGGPREYSDAAAVMFHNGNVPPITMGSADDPVNIWYWRANWQYGGMSSGGDMYAYPHPENVTKPGEAAGNPLSTTERNSHSYYAKSFGTLTYAPEQPIRATGQRTEDGWDVVFVRERATAGTYDAAFNGTDQTYLAFAVWNGSAGEVNGKKSITLRFSTLDTKTGEMGQANPSSGGSSSQGTSDSASDGGASDGGASDGSSPTGSWYRRTSTNFAASLAGIALVTWLVAYWRIREQ